jgi:4-hydroxy-2-oxoglutarate aldolase
MKLSGIYVPLTTPFTHDSEIYAAKLTHNISRLNLLGLAGYVVGGSTGEIKLLSHDEKEKIWHLSAEANNGKTLIAGTGMESVKETVELSNIASKIGYQAALVMTPHYYRSVVGKVENQLLYFRAVADQSQIPIIIYNFPQVSMYDLPTEAVARLSEHPNIIGIKESSGNVGKVMELIRDCKPGFQVVAGSANTLLPSLDLGASGGILAFGNCAPYTLITIWEAFRQRDREAAQDWQVRISKPVACVVTKHGIPGIKYAAELQGYYGGPCRLPLAPLSVAAKSEIDRLMADLPS